MQQKTVLITGAASGVGKATAELFQQHGWQVYASGRTLRSVQAQPSLRDCVPVELDVTSAASVDRALATVLAHAGRLDVLVNNAAYGPLGDLETFAGSELRKMYETNVFGVMYLTQRVLPHMRRQGAGRIVNISSGGGEFTSPFAGAYHSTKYALEALSDALRFEAGLWGLHVSIVQPAAVATPMAENAPASFNLTDANPYKPYLLHLKTLAERAYAKQSGYVTPQQVAEQVYAAATRARPKARYKVGALARLFPFLRKHLPTAWWDGIWRHTYKTVQPR